MRNLAASNYFEKGHSLSLSQIQQSYDLVDTILEGLDDGAMMELLSGSERDLDNLLGIIVEETTKALYSFTTLSSASLGYLDKLGASLDQNLKLHSFNYFTTTVMPDFEMNWHHIEWGNLVQIYKYLGIIAARSHSKSFTFSKAYPLWKLYRYVRGVAGQPAKKEFQLSKEGIIITSEKSLGIHLLGIVREEIENNDFLREALYPGNADGWGKESIHCKNGASIFVKSYNSKMRGRHPGWIVVDDFLTEASMYSSEQRAKFKNIFYAVIMNMIEPAGQVIVVGTPFSDLDLYNGELKKDKKWKVFEYPAIFPDGSLLWETRFGLEELLDKRQSQGSIIFSREILCKPVTSESTIFPYEMVSKCFRQDYVMIKNYYSVPTKFKRIVMGCDFSISANVSADYSVFITLGIDEFDRYWVLNVYREKGKTFQEQIAVIKMLYANFRFDLVVMEANQMQMVFVQEAKQSGIPVKPHHTGQNKYNLTEGLPSLAILLEQQKIFFPTGDQYSKDITDVVAMELSSIAWTDKGKLEGVGSHDDTTMSLLMAVIAARDHSGFDFAFM